MNLAKIALYLEYIAFSLRREYAPETIPNLKGTPMSKQRADTASEPIFVPPPFDAPPPIADHAAALPDNAAEPDTWAIVELMGHVKLAGRLTEEEKFGCKMGRLDIPEGDGFVTRYFGGQSVYCITYVSEEVARHVRKQTTAAPVSPWDFPKQLTQVPATVSDDDYEPDPDDDHPY